MSPLPVPGRPWEMFIMDLIVQLPDSDGYDAIVVFVCLYSKMVHVVPIVHVARCALEPLSLRLSLR